MLAIASWQAFRSRDIKSEFSEGVYIGLAVFSMAQAFLTGIPIVAVVREIPEAFYLVLTFLIFFLCMVILLLIFLPKFFMERTYASLSQADQKKMMASSVRESAQPSSSIFMTSVRDSSVQGFRVPDSFPKRGLLGNEQEAMVKEEGSNDEPKQRSSVLESTVSTHSGGLPENISQPMENEEEEAEVKEEGKDYESRPGSVMESVNEDTSGGSPERISQPMENEKEVEKREEGKGYEPRPRSIMLSLNDDDAVIEA